MSYINIFIENKMKISIFIDTNFFVIIKFEMGDYFEKESKNSTRTCNIYFTYIIIVLFIKLV